jgi:hypothetical protein
MFRRTCERMKKLALISLACAAALAQQAPRQQEKASVQGQVVNAQTGEPIRKAQVTLRPVGGGGQPGGGQQVGPAQGMQGLAATTDGGGNFAFPSLDAGRYRLSADRAGFVAAEYAAKAGTPAGITLSAGQKLTSASIRLTPQAVLTGRVLDEDGDPVAEANVQALRYSYTRGVRQLTPALSTTTDDRGEYRLYGLAPGKYYVAASRGGFGGGRGGGRLVEVENARDNYVQTYYPNSADASAASAVDAAAGAVVGGLDINLAKVRTSSVSGTVTDAAGKPAPRNTRVYVAPRDGASGFGRQMPAMLQAGRFTVRGLRPGSYVVGADAWDGEKRASARAAVDVGPDPLDNVTLTLAPALDVKGSVRVDGAASAGLASVQVTLQPTSGGAMGGSVGGRVKDDGSFTLANAPPDLYTVSLSGLPQGFYVKSIRNGQADALASGVNLAHAAGPLDIVVSPGGGSVDGAVSAGDDPAPGATVVALPDARRPGFALFVRTATADDSGHFTIAGLAPGDYRLYSWKTVDSGAWLDPDFVKPFESSAEAVSIQDNSHETKQLKALAAPR